MTKAAVRGVRNVSFERLTAPAFFFEHAATILVVQGMVLQDFFPPDVYFRGMHVASPRIYGPFLLLKGELSMPWDLPMRLKNMVLARGTTAPDDITREELLGILLTSAGADVNY